MSKVNQSVVLTRVWMENPVVVASGTFGFDRGYGRFCDLSELGGICCKGLTLCRQEGNPPPASQRLSWVFSTPWASRIPEWTPLSRKSYPS